MDLNLTGKVAWVTGGSGGIGSAVATELAAEGCEVAITGRDLKRLEAAAQEISAKTGRQVLAVPADTSNRSEVDDAAHHIEQQLGGIDILVNCAGAPGGKANGPLEDVSDELMLEDMNEKYIGYLRCARAAARSMKQRGFGRMVHVGGLSSRVSGSYSAGGRNAAIVHLSKTLSDELGQYGITSNVVHPAMTRSPWFEGWLARAAEHRGTPAEEIEHELAQDYAIRRLVDASELAHVVTFLCSPRSAGVTGETIAAGGGAQRGVSY